jgi:hypothetical protein
MSFGTLRDLKETAGPSGYQPNEGDGAVSVRPA